MGDAIGGCVAVLIMAVVLAGCGTTHHRAEKAFAREDWVEAARQYDRALQTTTNASERQEIKARLDHARAQGAAEQSRRAAVSQAAGDTRGAIKALETLVALDPRVENAEQLRRLKETHAQQLTARGDQAFESRNWNAANQAYGEALSFADLGASSARAVFCRHMSIAEAAVARGDSSLAKAQFEAARRTGVDDGVVDSRMRDSVPQRYRLTFDSALVLPFKPGSHRPWDGTGGKVPGAGNLLADLAELQGPSGFLFAQASQIVVDTVAHTSSVPDCYPGCSADGKTKVRRDLVDNVTCTPHWGWSFEFTALAHDATVVTFFVRDRDLVEDDSVGSWQCTVAELVAAPGPQQRSFVGEDGTLTAGALLALNYSVELLDE